MLTAAPKSLSPLGLTSDQFVAAAAGRFIVDRVGGRGGALEVYRRVFRAGVRDFPGAEVTLPEIVRTHEEDCPEGRVVKFVSRLGPMGLRPATGSVRPGAAPTELIETPLDVESVLIPMIGSTRQPTYTLCVSSQVGCAMGCGFCETAQMGLIRSLTTEEIVSQWYTATHVLGHTVKNIVFMGMGEPLDNFDNVMQAIAVLKDDNGPRVPISQITVSTVGRVDGLRKMAERIKTPGWHRLGLAVSLNASNDQVRDELMPINRKWKMAELQSVLIDWPRFAGNKICIEYVMIPGINDGPEHLNEIAAFLEPFKVTNGGKPRAMLNLIPYNPRRNSPWPAPKEEDVEAFLQALHDRGVFAKRRRTKGRTMMGACGQLGTESIRGRRLVQSALAQSGAANSGLVQPTISLER